MVDMDKIVSLSKRRGFIFQSSEIYGGLGSAWDYGPLGVELKNNVKRLWWRDNVHLRDDMVGLDAAITMHPRVWEASGHLASFSDPFTGCLDCGRHYRADHVEEAGKNSKWWQTLQAMGDKQGISVEEIRRWARSEKEGKKLAPNLPLVKDPNSIFPIVSSDSVAAPVESQSVQPSVVLKSYLDQIANGESYLSKLRRQVV